MAHQELFDCSICLQLLEDPVTTACGHSYCMKCIHSFWDTNIRGGIFSCPQCRQTFNPRPVLRRNTLLADLLEEHRKTACPNNPATAAVATSDTLAAPGDVQCDACTGLKRRARMFCLVCLVSYCDRHLRPHFEVPPLRKHKLIQASTRIRESVCSRHDKLLEIHCRTDQKFICLQCAMDEHKGHETVAVEAEKCDMQRQLEKTKKEIANRVLDSEEKMIKLRHAADFLRVAAWEVCDDFERMCEESIRSYASSMKRKCYEMREKVGEAEKAGVDWTNRCHGQLERQVLMLRKGWNQIDQLLLIEDPMQFVQGFKALDDLPDSTDSYESLDMLTAFVTEKKDKMKDMCNKEKDLFSCHLEKNIMSKIPSIHEGIKSREHLLKIYKNSDVEVDPNTVAACLCLSDRNRELSWGGIDQAHPDHPDRFTYYHQALCKPGLTGNHYWEVEWDGGIVEVAVSYKDIERKGSGKECSFGHNDLSWKLVCFPSHCSFWHNNLHNGRIRSASSRKIGVHLDFQAGILCFYGVSHSGSHTVLHQIKTTFTKPLYPGFSVDLGSTLKICNI